MDFRVRGNDNNYNYESGRWRGWKGSLSADRQAKTNG
jgi:hypothetical protein